MSGSEYGKISEVYCLLLFIIITNNNYSQTANTDLMDISAFFVLCIMVNGHECIYFILSP